ncbi:hypothetical protein QTP70_032995, partial [Hemibagrus guttatus]
TTPKETSEIHQALFKHSGPAFHWESLFDQEHSQEKLEEMLTTKPHEFKRCKLKMERHDLAYAKPLDDPTTVICISGSDVGRSFPGDEVCVKILSREVQPHQEAVFDKTSKVQFIYVLTPVFQEMKASAKKDYHKLVHLIISDEIHPTLRHMANEFKEIQKKASILRSCSNFSSKLGHYDLQLNAYTWASSPMRRYLDLILQRLHHSVLSKTDLDYTKDEIIQLCDECDCTEDLDLESLTFLKATKPSSSNVTKLAIVGQLSPRAHEFFISVPLDGIPQLMINYRNLKVVEQPDHKDKDHSCTLKWKRRVYSFSKASEPQQQAEIYKNVIPISVKNWMKMISAVKDEAWDKVSECLQDVTEEINIIKPVNTSDENHYKEWNMELKLAEVLRVQLGTEVINKNTLPFTWVAHGVPTQTEAKKKKKKKNLQIIRIPFQINHQNMTNYPPELKKEETKFTVEVIPKKIPYVQYEHAIDSITKANKLVKSIAMGTVHKRQPEELHPAIDQMYEQLDLNEKLNESQKMAVQNALKNSFTVIQGPPGTGKTVVGVYITHHFYMKNKFLEENCPSQPARKEHDASSNEEKPKKRGILYCGPSNKSVDIVAEQLLKQRKELKPLRIYCDQMEMREFPYPGSDLNLCRRSFRDEEPKEVLRTSNNFFSNLSNNSSSVGSDHTGQPSLPTCINEPWPPMTLSPVHHCSDEPLQ